MTLENKEGRQDGALEACNAEAAKHEASEQLNVFDKGRMEGLMPTAPRTAPCEPSACPSAKARVRPWWTAR